MQKVPRERGRERERERKRESKEVKYGERVEGHQYQMYVGSTAQSKKERLNAALLSDGSVDGVYASSWIVSMVLYGSPLRSDHQFIAR